MVLTESALEFCSLCFPTFPYALGYVVFSLTTDTLLYFSGIGTLRSPCVFNQVTRTECTSITLRDQYRLLDWRYSRILACARLL